MIYVTTGRAAMDCRIDDDGWWISNGRIYLLLIFCPLFSSSRIDIHPGLRPRELSDFYSAVGMGKSIGRRN